VRSSPAFTHTVSDPILKAALALQGEEETRHANLIRVMIAVHP
jgi:hypothetical protein